MRYAHHTTYTMYRAQFTLLKRSGFVSLICSLLQQILTYREFSMQSAILLPKKLLTCDGLPFNPISHLIWLACSLDKWNSLWEKFCCWWNTSWGTNLAYHLRNQFSYKWLLCKWDVASSEIPFWIGHSSIIETSLIAFSIIVWFFIF